MLIVGSEQDFETSERGAGDEQDQKIIKTKVGLLELAKQLGNVRQACRIMGCSSSFYF